MEQSGAGFPPGPLPPRRFREDRAPKPRRFLGWTLYILVLILVFAAALRTSQALLPRPEESVVVVEGQVELFAEIEAFVVRDERITSAPFSGTVKHLVSDGERVRVGADLIEFHRDGDVNPTVITADISGVVHFETDGLEGYLTPRLIETWSTNWFRQLPPALPQKISQGRAEAGQPLFKIADSLSRGLIALADARLLGSIESGRQVGVRVGARDGGLYPGRMTHIQRGPEHVMIYIVAEHLPEAMSITRRARVSILLHSITGKLVPATAIDVRGGRQGVWAMEAGQDRFLPVKVLGGDAIQVAIEAEIPLGTRIRRIAPSHPD